MKIEYKEPKTYVVMFEKLEAGEVFTVIDRPYEHFMKTVSSGTINAVRLEDGELISFRDKDYVHIKDGTFVID